MLIQFLNAEASDVGPMNPNTRRGFTTILQDLLGSANDATAGCDDGAKDRVCCLEKMSHDLIGNTAPAAYVLLVIIREPHVSANVVTAGFAIDARGIRSDTRASESVTTEALVSSNSTLKSSLKLGFPLVSVESQFATVITWLEKLTGQLSAHA